MVKLWLDDLRPAPEGWVRSKGVNDAIEILRTGGVTHASLDHDLGIWSSEGGSGVALTDWMAEHNVWPTLGLRVHSSNPEGVRAMLATVDRYGPYGVTGRVGSVRGVEPNGGWPPSDTYV